MILLLLAIRPELLEVSQQIAHLLLILQTGIDHFRAGNFGPRILDIFAESRLVPGDTRVFVRSRIRVACKGPRGAADHAVQHRPDRIFCGLADLMARLAHAKNLFTSRSILRLGSAYAQHRQHCCKYHTSHLILLLPVKPPSRSALFVFGCSSRYLELSTSTENQKILAATHNRLPAGCN